MVDSSNWIQPGAAATLIWYDGVRQASQGRAYQVAGPALEHEPESSYFLLAPVEQDRFASRLYASEVSLGDLHDFLGACRVAEGGMDTGCEFVVARRETSVLPLLDAWASGSSGEVVPFLGDVNAFLLDRVALFATPEAHAAIQRMAERFGVAWVCEECGQADDQAVFLWTAHASEAIQVRLAIQNAAGVWTCWLHPFRIPRESS